MYIPHACRSCSYIHTSIHATFCCIKYLCRAFTISWLKLKHKIFLRFCAFFLKSFKYLCHSFTLSLSTATALSSYEAKIFSKEGYCLFLQYLISFLYHSLWKLLFMKLMFFSFYVCMWLIYIYEQITRLKM